MIEAVSAIAGNASVPALLPPSKAASGFSAMLLEGVAAAEEKLSAAESLVRAYALDDSVPIHQVTFALEEARLRLEIVNQVRTRLIESFQELQRVQL